MSCFWRNAGTKYINTYIYAYCKIQYSICIRHQRWDVNICAIGCTFSYLSVWLLPTSWWKLFSGSQAIARSPEEGIDICNDAGDEKTSGGLVTPTIKTRVRQYQGSRTIYYFRFIFPFQIKTRCYQIRLLLPQWLSKRRLVGERWTMFLSCLVSMVVLVFDSHKAWGLSMFARTCWFPIMDPSKIYSFGMIW